MKAVLEHRDNNGGSYYTITDGKKRTTVDITCRVGKYDGEEVDVLYDADMNILFKPSAYLYHELRYASENTRLQAVSALKALFSYGQIVGVDPVVFDKVTAEGFIRFLRGYMREGASWSFKLLTHRAETTINAYLKFVRDYMRYLEVDNSPFLLPALKKYKRSSRHMALLEKYELSAKVSTSLEVPAYISMGEYLELLEVVPKNDDPDRVIQRLMYEHGLRIGEVLGLTLEDLCQERLRDGSADYCVKLRDRISDKRWQKAKSLVFKPQSVEEYASPSYRQRNVGYQLVFISEDLYFEIIDYVERAHSLAASTTGYVRSLADSTNGNRENHYLFLNSRGAALSANLWGKRQRAYFRTAGLPVDENVRMNNLNHRLRHGYAMFLTRELGLDEFIVKTLMRHKNFTSTEVYLKATAEDIHMMYKVAIGGLHRRLLGKEVE